MSEHTPGPWKVMMKGIDDDGVTSVWDEKSGRMEVNVCGPYHPGAERDANAQLIAAAPDLLEACEDTMRFLERYADPDSNELWAKVTAAIRKARGENQ